MTRHIYIGSETLLRKVRKSKENVQERDQSGKTADNEDTGGQGSGLIDRRSPKGR